MSLFNFFRKPRIAPPSELNEPDLDALDPIISKQKPFFDKFISSNSQELQNWVKYKKAMDDLIFLNFMSISHFMDMLYMNKKVHKLDLEEIIKTSTTYAASCGWMIGREWANNNYNLLAKLINKSFINSDDVPSDAMILLYKATNLPYWHFAVIFTEYYDSPYGQRTRPQKDSHFKDTYQSLLIGVLVCFLDGVKSQSKYD